jgi:endonuclease/exonuclease/phosphatase family metal-dependent hydrolase
VRITSWNLLHGQKVSGVSKTGAPAAASNSGESESPGASLRTIAGLLTSDVVGLQEIDENQPRSGEYSQIKELAKLSQAESWGYGRCVIGTPGVRWRKLKKNESQLITNESEVKSYFESSYGIGLISKVPVKKWHLLTLGRSIIGLPLPVASQRGLRFMYVKDEPRIAIAAELENGYTVAVTHLSFVPFMNLYQLFRVKRWLGKLPGKQILMGDLNLPFNIPVKFSKWRSLSEMATYPTWGPKIQFDYILCEVELNATRITHEPTGFSDHLPVTIEIN